MICAICPSDLPPSPPRAPRRIRAQRAQSEGGTRRHPPAASARGPPRLRARSGHPPGAAGARPQPRHRAIARPGRRPAGAALAAPSGIHFVVPIQRPASRQSHLTPHYPPRRGAGAQTPTFSTARPPGAPRPAVPGAAPHHGALCPGPRRSGQAGSPPGPPRRGRRGEAAGGLCQ